MERSVAVAAVLAVVVLRLLSAGAPERAAPSAPSMRPAGPVGAGPHGDDVGRLAAAIEARLAAGDVAGVLALFAPDAQVKERLAPGLGEGYVVRAAGPARVAAWVRGCLLPARPELAPTHPLGCHRRRTPDRVGVRARRERLGPRVGVRARRHGRLLRPHDPPPAQGPGAVGVAPALHATCLAAFDKMIGLRLSLDAQPAIHVHELRCSMSGCGVSAAQRRGISRATPEVGQMQPGYETPLTRRNCGFGSGPM